ncbi:MAG: 16S rRNA (cytidine(1402)-2'-O)-methyltransferase [Lachnospiraceae bacterium]|nr:16S rRNA (cytidine(1402)-2'-O)-methyltransferase [Lachnospiraceae bacterium]
MAGILYLCATPIGNLEDMTARGLRMLKEVDLIACEDTRTSGHLLKYFGITTPVTSYHKFNEETKGEELLRKLLAGQSIAVITDAGMPGISDPGEILVRKCHEAGVTVTALPGASASVTALALSGQATRRFVFEGFLPTETKEKEEALSRIRKEERTVILYEAPHRLIRTLTSLRETVGGGRSISLCRELTKKHEEIVKTTIGEALAAYETKEPRGEYVLVLAGKSHEEAVREETAKWQDMDISSHVAMYEARGQDHKTAMKSVAADRGISRRDVYQALLKEKDN